MVIGTLNILKTKYVYIINLDAQSLFLETYFSIFRFFAGPDNFDTVDENPENGCFCGGSPQWCGKYSGLYNISECQYGAPVFASWPHFFQVCKQY